MIVESKYLDRDFDIQVTSYTNKVGQELTIISHEVLEDIVHNQVKDLDIMYDYNVVQANTNHSVVICTMSDSAGRRIQALGESVQQNLANFGKEYPTLIASQRAFDRAAIRYLNLPGKIYSDMEIIERNNDDGGLFAEEKAMKNDAPADDVLFAEQEVQDGVETSEFSDEQVPSVKTSPVSVKVSGEDGAEDVGGYIINVGKYKGKGMAIREIAEKDMNWCQWMIDKSNSNSKDLEMLKKFFDK